MNMQLRKRFARAKPFRLKKSQKKPNFGCFFLFPKKAKKVFKRSQNFKIWLQKSRIANPDQQFSVFIFADTYAGLLYYVIIRFLCRAQSIIAKFALSS